MVFLGTKISWRVYPSDVIEIAMCGMEELEIIPLNIPASDFWQKIKNYAQKN